MDGLENEPIGEARSELAPEAELDLLRQIEALSNRVSLGKVLDFSSRVMDLEEEIHAQDDPKHTIEIKKDEGRVRIGTVYAPIFEEEERKYSPKFELAENGNYYQIILEDEAGNTFSDPRIVADDNDLENPEVRETIKLAEKSRQKAETGRKTHLPKSPERNPFFVEMPYAVERMAEQAQNLNRQAEKNEGILIMVGDAGAGKNLMNDHYAYLTNRPIFRFTCSAGKEEQDLKYLLEFDPQKGTYRISSTLVEALQTPGAILELDEINTLKPEIAKILNSLLDYRRTLYFGENNLHIKAAEGVLIVGLMNPEDYAGVEPLPETIRSRARMMEVGYPPYFEQKDGRNYFRADEAMVLRQYLPELKSLHPKEFLLLWDQIINGRSSSLVESIITRERELRIKQLNDIVYVANKTRSARNDYLSGISEEPVEFIFSLRESVVMAQDLADIKPDDEEGTKKIIEDVVLSKIPRGEKKIKMQDLVNESWIEVKGS